jgi:hypothetical protein
VPGSPNRNIQVVRYHINIEPVLHIRDPQHFLGRDPDPHESENATEAHSGVMETHSGAMEAHSGATVACSQVYTVPYSHHFIEDPDPC